MIENIDMIDTSIIEYYQKRRTEIISKLLDNPNEFGIYPTTECYKELDDLLIECFVYNRYKKLTEINVKRGS